LLRPLDSPGPKRITARGDDVFEVNMPAGAPDFIGNSGAFERPLAVLLGEGNGDGLCIQGG
jgi:hypothetical protein